MLNIPHKQLDAIYDKILKLGLAEVVTIRREVQLTTKGVRYISNATKSQTNRFFFSFRSTIQRSTIQFYVMIS